MRETECTKQIKKENREYKKIKFWFWIKMKLTFSNEKRKKKEFSYSIFQREKFYDNKVNALPEDLYFKPTDIVLYDLIQKQDLEIVKKGLGRLFKKCLSHKFLGVSKGQDDIDDIIHALDGTLDSGKSWYKVGLFDFAYSHKLNSYIEYFEICLRNFSSSFVAVEMKITLNEEYQKRLSDFTKREYKKTGMRVHKMWKKSKRKSGAVIGYAVSSGMLSEYVKSRLLYEQLQYVKELFLKEMTRLFPFLQYKKGGKIYGINVYETNIDCEVNYDISLINALGMDLFTGFYFSNAEKLFVSTAISTYRDSYESDMMFVYNPNKVTEFEGYVTPHNKVLDYLTEGYMNELYSMIVIKEIGIYYLDRSSFYRNQVNSLRTDRGFHKRLLKLKYEMEKEFYTYSKIEHEFSVAQEADRITELLKKNVYARDSVCFSFHPYLVYAGSPKYIWGQIKINHDEILNDLQNKIDIASSLSEYSNSRHDYRLGWLQLILAVSTFVLLIFPEKAILLADMVKTWWDYIKAILELL